MTTGRHATCVRIPTDALAGAGRPDGAAQRFRGSDATEGHRVGYLGGRIAPRSGPGAVITADR